jgi:hypothetical protein
MFDLRDLCIYRSLEGLFDLIIVNVSVNLSWSN